MQGGLKLIGRGKGLKFPFRYPTYPLSFIINIVSSVWLCSGTSVINR